MPNKPNILIVDDEKSNLKILSEILKNEASILIAKNGEQALNKARQLQPTLILLDVIMPDISGFEVISALKADQQTHAIPVIFISGLTDADNEDKGLSLGACDYIHKPFHSGIVKARIKLQLKLVQQARLLEQLAHIDPLTLLANRSRFDQVLAMEWLAARRDHSNLSILMIAIDAFKRFNQCCGYPAGDEMLATVAEVLNGQFSAPGDLVARYEGNAFVVILTDSGSENIDARMAACCQAVESLQVSISIGGISCQPNEHVDSNTAVAAAGEQLALAKKCGQSQAKWQCLPNMPT